MCSWLEYTFGIEISGDLCYHTLYRWGCDRFQQIYQDYVYQSLIICTCYIKDFNQIAKMMEIVGFSKAMHQRTHTTSTDFRCHTSMDLREDRGRPRSAHVRSKTSLSITRSVTDHYEVHIRGVFGNIKLNLDVPVALNQRFLVGLCQLTGTGDFVCNNDQQVYMSYHPLKNAHKISDSCGWLKLFVMYFIS